MTGGKCLWTRFRGSGGKSLSAVEPRSFGLQTAFAHREGEGWKHE